MPVDTPSHSSFLPMPLDASMEPFRVDGTLAVRALVRELVNARALVMLYAGEDPDTFIVTCIQSLEADAMEIDVTAGDADLVKSLLQAPFVTVVGVAGSVTIQFRLDDMELTNLPADGADGLGSAVLTAAVPSRGWRVQRRNTFRVSPPLKDHAVVAVPLPDDGEVRGRLTDLSVGGLSLLWADATEQPEPGATLRHCRIEANGIAPIPCDLRIVRVDRPDPDQPAQVSCEFHAMPQTVSRFLQMYVMDIEKRARAAARRT
jgi:c-di-GMP-binding flagellar brake protein YcgR